MTDPFESALVAAQDSTTKHPLLSYDLPEHLKVQEPINATPESFWGVVEIMGHRRHAGRISEIHFANTKLVRIEIPGPVQGTFCKTYQYGGSAIFGLHPCTEAEAREEAESNEWRNQPSPQHRLLDHYGDDEPDHNDDEFERYGP